LAARTDCMVLLNTIADDLPLAISWVTFTPNTVSLGDQEKQKEWLPTCFSFEVIGAFAQTYVGHDSNIRVLETTATVVLESKDGMTGGSFVNRSHTLTNAKAWPGPLGNPTVLLQLDMGCNPCPCYSQRSAIGRYDSVHHLLLASEAAGKRPHDSYNEATVGMAPGTYACAQYLLIYNVQAGLEQEAQKSTLGSAELNFSRSCANYFAL
jgi:hypothetical protein